MENGISPNNGGYLLNGAHVLLSQGGCKQDIKAPIVISGIMPTSFYHWYEFFLGCGEQM